MTTITARIGAAPTADNTLRIAVQGATDAIPSSIGDDTWGGTWGNTWGFSWFDTNAAIAAVPASPAADNTVRVSGSPSGGSTKRVSL
jgi:hypothetical protein